MKTTLKKIWHLLTGRRLNRLPAQNTKVDRCICCGEPIPEGRMVCWRCEHEGGKNDG